MLDDESIAKIEAYFERIGINMKELHDCKVVLEMDDGEIIGHIFLSDDDEIPIQGERLGSAPKKIIH